MHPKYIQKSTQKSKQKKDQKSKKSETILHGKIELKHRTVVKKQRFRGFRKGSKNHLKNTVKSIKNQSKKYQKIYQKKTTLNKY